MACGILAPGSHARGAPATQPTAPSSQSSQSSSSSSPKQPPAGVDAALWSRMVAIDERAGRIQSLVADFEQRKFTALLKRPLVSSGVVRVKGSTMRWDTRQPHGSVLLITEREVRIFYPDPPPGVVEIYGIDQRMGELAASPLPRLAVLKDRFSFQQVPTAELDPKVDPARFLALRMTPIDPALREHVREVRVLLDVSAGYIVRAEMTDADGDRTLLHFTSVTLNTIAGEIDLKVPAGAKVTRPLEGIEGPPGGSEQRSAADHRSPSR
jgi:outer membrane lipoprotein-sorting protein